MGTGGGRGVKLTTTEVKNGGAAPSLYPTSSWRGAYIIEPGDKFTFYFLHCGVDGDLHYTSMWVHSEIFRCLLCYFVS
jgi:hypothetical protein